MTTELESERDRLKAIKAWLHAETWRLERPLTRLEFDAIAVAGFDGGSEGIQAKLNELGIKDRQEAAILEMHP